MRQELSELFISLAIFIAVGVCCYALFQVQIHMSECRKELVNGTPCVVCGFGVRQSVSCDFKGDK